MWPKRDDERENCAEDTPAPVQLLPPGTAVVARGERWRVDATVPHEDCAEVHLTNADRSAVLLSPVDRFTSLDRPSRLRIVSPGRWASRLREDVSAPRVDRLEIAGARARILPYQLAPALAVAAGHARLLLADEVGLGKTVQAGWILAHALARHADARVLIVLPAGLRRQWQIELATHFGIEATAADARWLRRSAADLPGDVNPWSLPGVYLASLDFVKRSEVLRTLARQLWDVLAVDEIHVAAAPTDRHRALSALARRSRCVVMISATPFSGDDQSFASITGLGAGPQDDPPVMFRRSRDDAGICGRRRHRFALVTISRAERRLQRLLERYSRLVWRQAPDDDDGARLAMTVLRKRALSSPVAAAQSLQRRLQFLTSAGQRATQLTLFDSDEDPLDDEEPAGVLAPPGLRDAGLERRWLAVLIDAARRAAAFDSKLAFLRRLTRRTRRDAAIVFTEYRDTLAHLADTFPRALLLHGGLAVEQRDEVRRRFNTAGGLLLATDAAAEGLNLQGRCRLVVNYELPWNPARLEQRIGRVDRIGQLRAVHAITLVACDTAEDLVLAPLVRRLHHIASTLGERDRLTAFLGEARIAAMVIGGIPPDERPGLGSLTNIAPATSQVEAHAPSFANLPASNLTEEAADEANRLSWLPPRAGRSPTVDIPVCVISARQELREGIVFLVRWSASTSDGRVVDSDIRIVHANERLRRSCRRAAEVRHIATALLDQYREDVLGACDEWARSRLATAEAAYNAIINRQLERERLLLTFNQRGVLFQPGLFDTRAVHEADESRAERIAIEREHRRRIESLERSRPLQGRCDIRALLLVRGVAR
jgi:superfamily II DNA or RNA helicase